MHKKICAQRVTWIQVCTMVDEGTRGVKSGFDETRWHSSMPVAIEPGGWKREREKDLALSMWQRRMVDILFQAKCQDWQTHWNIAQFEFAFISPPLHPPREETNAGVKGQVKRHGGRTEAAQKPFNSRSLVSCLHAFNYIGQEPHTCHIYIQLILIVIHQRGVAKLIAWTRPLFFWCQKIYAHIFHCISIRKWKNFFKSRSHRFDDQQSY